MAKRYTLAELEAYLDEALAPEEMAALEQALRGQPELVRQLAAVNARRDAGVHTLGESGADRGSAAPLATSWEVFPLSALPPEQADYLVFHVEQVGCRFCRANLDDMKRQQAEVEEAVVHRRTRYFQSSAGYLRRKP